MSQLFTNPVWGVIGAVGTFAAIFLSIVLYLKSRRRKVPLWAIRIVNLVEKSAARLPEFKILYGEETVDNLSISKIIFWNDGSETIKGEDMPVADPILIKGRKEVKIQDIKLIKSNNIASQISAVIDETGNSAKLFFDYLDCKQGGILQVVHTGTSSEDVEVVGTIKGGAPLRRVKIAVANRLPLPIPEAFKKKLSTSLRRTLSFSIVMLYPAIMAIMLISYLLTMQEPVSVSDYISLGIVSPIFVAGCTIFVAWSYGKAYRAPRGLEEFEEDV